MYRTLVAPPPKIVFPIKPLCIRLCIPVEKKVWTHLTLCIFYILCYCAVEGREFDLFYNAEFYADFKSEEKLEKVHRKSY